MAAHVYSVRSTLSAVAVRNERVKVIDVSGCETDNGTIVYQIEEVGNFYNYVSVQGYAYLPGEDINVSCMRVLMYDEAEKYLLCAPDGDGGT